VVDPNGISATGVRVQPWMIRDSIIGNVHAVPEQIQSQLVQTSDAAGFCVIPGLPLGQEISFEIADEKVVRRMLQVQTTDSPVTVATEPLQMELGGIIEGRLTMGDTGTPAAGVRIDDRDTSTYSYYAMTDADGRFRLTRLRPGIHRFEIRLDYPLSRDCAVPKLEPISLTARQIITGREIRLVPGTAIRGKVTAQGTGEPLPGITIYATVRTSEPGTSANVGSTRTEPDGTYMLRVLPDVHTVRADARDRVDLLLAGASNPQVAVEEGKDVTVDFTFRPSPTAARYGVAPVKGTVVDEQGNPVQGARVTLSYGTDYHMQDGRVVTGPPSITRAMGDGSRTATDAAGRFELPAAGNGAFLRVRKGALALPKPIAIGADRDLNLTLAGNTAGSAVVHVIGDADQPLAGVDVGVRISNGVEELASRWGTTGPDGTFTLSPVYGDRNYRVLIAEPGYTSGSVTFSGSAGQRIDIPPITLIKADSFITGTVIDETGAPLPNAYVTTSGGRAGYRSVQTNAEGRFRIDKLVAGDMVSISTNAGRTGDFQTQVQTGTQDVVIMHVPRPTSSPTPRGGVRATTRGAR
jgi:uncharacterized GH25 family protein